MDLIDNTSEPNDTALVAEVTNTGNAPQPVASIAPEDQHYLDAIRKMDRINDVPGVVSVPEGRKFPLPTLEALSPEDRIAVRESMSKAGIAPARQQEREAEFVQAHLRAQLPSIRVQTGLGANALPVHREECAIAREYNDLRAEYLRYDEDLNRVSHYTTEVDPETGERRPVAVPQVEGTRRAAFISHQHDLARRMRLLYNDDGSDGIETARRMREAEVATVALLKARDEARAEREEAKRRGAELAREARINRQAESIARMSAQGG